MIDEFGVENLNYRFSTFKECSNNTNEVFIKKINNFQKEGHKTFYNVIEQKLQLLREKMPEDSNEKSEDVF